MNKSLATMQNLRRPFGIAGALLALVGFELGCGRGGSSLRETFKTDTVMRAAGAPQGASIKLVKKPEMLDHDPESSGTGSFTDFDIRLSSCTCEQLLTNYQAQVTSCLQSNGATIVRYEPAAAGLAAEEGNFRFCFTRSDEQAIVRVIWGTHATNHHEVIVIYAEGGTKPYW
jgi:hypothetical protein